MSPFFSKKINLLFYCSRVTAVQVGAQEDCEMYVCVCVYIYIHVYMLTCKYASTSQQSLLR